MMNNSHLNHGQIALDDRADILFRAPLGLEPVSNIFCDRHMREERIILKHDAHATPVGRQMQRGLFVDQDVAVGRNQKARDGAQ